jgi:hypothetical protein
MSILFNNLNAGWLLGLRTVEAHQLHLGQQWYGPK